MPATPLPKLRMAVLSVVLLTESICTTMLVPFVGFFVATLLDWEVKRAGYASGFLVGLYMLGQLLSSTFWASISDTYGRKIALICGCLGSSICVMCFGLSVNIWLACLFRFLHGLFGGISPVAKTMIVDLTDKSNQAKGFALVSLTWAGGTLLGPSIGGFLYATNEDSATCRVFGKTSFFCRYPASLPTLVVSAYCMFAAVFCCLCITETNFHAIPLTNMFPRCQWLHPLLRVIQPSIPAKDVTIVGEDGVETQSNTPSLRKVAPLTYKEVFTLPRPRTVCIISMLVAVPDMLYAEVFPLWAIAPVAVGGIALMPESVALLTLINAGPSIGANLIFAYVLSLFKEIGVFWAITQVMYGVTTMWVPFAVYTGSAAFYYTMACNMSRKIFETWTFGTLMLAVARASPEGKVSSMYAIQQGLSCIVRCIVPFVGAPLYAFSVDGHKIFPFNHFLCFILCFIPLLVSAAITFRYKVTADEEESTEVVNASFTGSVRSHQSFLPGAKSQDGTEDEKPLFLRNTLSSLVNSFATNPVPNLLQPTIVPIFPSRMRNLEDAMSMDSRDASSQNSENDVDDTYCHEEHRRSDDDDLPTTK
ncbi:transporter-like protein [Angomonas deanei]|uniref:Major Facilitator Superfamily/Sugar (And other) transporter, putative n=1 Tax=Angomonas deanei TaxID=59799 RepID=A0A7G2CAF2_9TRYP|nr:transporter-like protein [Angomonas deanei]CAD2216756.1 Major Facilitator Superfamily/Sugar (and other) transporter, putative [Angomonas deanei]|eukprot:EPY35433.1 transporter-like protein [Angomonas deanei]